MQLSVPLNRLSGAYERYGRVLPPAANALLVIAVAFVLARLVWALVPVPESAEWQPAPVAPTAPGPRAQGADVNAIVAAHLFGAYTGGPQSPDLSKPAPDTRLPLTLLGILAGSSESDSLALISSQPGDERPYAIGDDVQPGTTLQAIYPDRVILARGGQLETLRLDKDQPGSAAPYVMPRNQVEEGVDEDDGGEVDETGGMISQIREQVMQDPSKASEFIRVQPANAGGTLRGYRIYPGRDRALFNEAGLRPGDLVTAVNGIQLDDTQKALQMLNDLSRASDVTLTIERGGQVQTVTVSLN